jgi:hypothetical protein
MPKTVPASKFTELKGLDRISTIVHEELKCLFREITKDDVGIDGEIEVVVPKPNGKGFETTGGIIKVQSKSGGSYVRQDTATTFSTPVEKNDLDTWYQSTYPVIFIVYHPKDDTLYWKDVRSFVKSTSNVWQPPYRITFDKATDAFTAASYDAIRNLAGISPPRVSMQQKERLFSNLLLIKRMPLLMTSAVAKVKDYHAIRSQIQGFIPPFCIIEDRLYTLSDLRNRDCTLRDFCDLSTNVNDVPAKQWIDDEVRRRDYVFLLNQLLGIHLRRCGLRYNPHFDRNYFPRQDPTGLEFKQDWFNVRTSRAAPPRIIAKYYTYALDKFWRHLAVNISFRMIGSSWYLQIIPKYFFTVDGETPYDRDKIGPYTTRLKARERNIHVLNHVLFWADVLSMRTPAIELKLDYKTVMVVEKLPVSGTAHFAIPFDPAIYEESDDTTTQMSLIPALFGASSEQEMEESNDELDT